MAGANSRLRDLAPARDVALSEALAALDEARSGLGWIAQTLELHGREEKEVASVVAHAKFHRRQVQTAIQSCEAKIAAEDPLFALTAFAVEESQE